MWSHRRTKTYGHTDGEGLTLAPAARATIFVFIGIFVLLATKPAYISAHMCVFVETALQVGEGEREIPDCHKASIHLSTHVERERESRESERASERVRQRDS